MFKDWIYETQNLIVICITKYCQNFLDLDHGDDDLDEEGKVGLVASSLALTDKNNTTRQLCRRHLFSSSSLSWWPDLLMLLSTIAMLLLIAFGYFGIFYFIYVLMYLLQLKKFNNLHISLAL